MRKTYTLKSISIARTLVKAAAKARAAANLIYEDEWEQGAYAQALNALKSARAVLAAMEKHRANNTKGV